MFLRCCAVSASLRPRRALWSCRTIRLGGLVSRQHLSTSSPKSLLSACSDILANSDAEKKISNLEAVRKSWSNGDMELGHVDDARIWDYPGRPSEPELVDVKEMPSHKEAGVSLPVYLLQGLAHIEFNAMHLYLDTLVRFADHSLPTEFYSDMLEIAADEARHFGLVQQRLRELGSHYGAIPAHKTLWDHALNTRSDLLGRIAVVPLVQEARGLDAGPRLVGKLRGERDSASAAIVQLICDEEERHVRHGMKWFTWLCARDGNDPVTEFHRLVRKYMKAGLARPFNAKARAAAGMDESWYMPVEMDKLRLEAKAARG